MLAKPVWSQIVDDEALTRGLGDPEARMLIEWLVDWADRLVERGYSEAETESLIQRLTRRLRAAARFVTLWCYDNDRPAAIQLAGAQRFGWALPTRMLDPCELMQDILHWEQEILDRETHPEGYSR